MAGLIKEAKAFHTKKQLGQHFLVSVEALQQITDALEIKPGETVIEVGPGIGFLTRLLTATGAKVVAVDLDRESIAVLNGMKLPNLELKHGDFLQFDLLSQDFFRKRNAATAEAAEGAAEGAAEAAIKGPSATTAEPVRMKVIGNVPYQITGLIIGHILGEIDQPSKWLPYIDTVVITVQREVAKRLVARASDEDYSRASLMIEYFCEAEIVAQIPASDFYPQPRVDSAVVRMRPRKTPGVVCKDTKLLRQLIQAGFRQRRKMYRNSLSFLRLPPSEIDAVFKELSIDPLGRAENLSLNQFGMLADAFHDSLKLHANNSKDAGSGED